MFEDAIQSLSDQQLQDLLPLMKILVEEGQELDAKISAINLKKNVRMLPPDSEDPVMARGMMITKLYPIVKKKYEEAAAEKQ